ncbi:hypothetical protein HY385_00800 [Candidatus Daviesbacteria bacterium]|nr:hypothetical protein [Candidatus Daviesbacteria bacterium]
MRERLATLISGGGTTMQEIVKACQSGEILIDVACVISSTPTAGGIEKARRLSIPEHDIVVVNPDDFRGGDGKVDQEGFGLQILKQLRERGVTVVTQNGWMPLTPRVVIEEYPETMFNQHPGPVPEFGGKGMYGRRVHAARLLFTRLTGRESWTEAIAQRMHVEYDQGSVVKATRVDILPDDAVDDLQQRVLPIEHRVQIDLLNDVATGNIKELTGRGRLVRPEEEQTLLLVKRVARLMFPHG